MPPNIHVADPTGILKGYAPAERHTPDKEERETHGALMERFNESANHRQQWDWSWEHNRNYLRGDQLLVRDRVSGEVLRLTVNRESKARKYSVENLMRPYSRALVGKLGRIIPTMNVVPGSDMPSDLKAAQVAETFLEFFERKERVRVKYIQGLRSLTWSGTYAHYLFWDPTKGRHLAVCSECGYRGDNDEVGKQCPVCQLENAQKAMMMHEQATQIYEQAGIMSSEMGSAPPQPPPEMTPKEAPILEAITEGDLRLERLDIRDLFPEPGVPEIKNWRYFFVRRATPVGDIRARFPAQGQFVSHEEGIYVDRSLGFHGALMDDRGSTRYLHDHAYLYEYHEAPSAEHKKGRLIFFTNSVLLEENEHPSYMDLDRFPIYPGRYETNEGEFWGEPPIQQAWSTQRERNRLLTQLRENRELTMRPKLLNPTNNKLGPTEIDTTPGQILSMPAYGQAPRWLEIPSVPQYVYMEKNDMAAGMRQQFSITEADLGFMSADQSGRSTALQEASASETLSPIIVENNDEWKEMYRGALILGLKHYPTDYLWSVIGRDRIRNYSMHQIALQPGWDVVLMEADSLSKNPAVRQQQVDGMWDRGIFTDPTTGIPDTRTYMRLANIRLPGIGPDTESSEHAYGSSIPDLIENGKFIGPRPFDDPFIMVEELAAWLRENGRGSGDPTIVQQVEQLYMYYASMLPYTPMTAQIAPNAGAQQMMQQQKPLGAGPGNTQGPGAAGANQATRVAGGGGTMGQEASKSVQIADASGEQQARMQQGHEG